jgi:hypothetical protein
VLSTPPYGGPLIRLEWLTPVFVPARGDQMKMH